MNVNILSPIGKGGPYNWSNNLKLILCKNGINAKCTNSLGNLLVSPLYQKADIIHTVVPLSYRFWNKPVVLTVHGNYKIEKNVWSLFYPISVSKADIITTPSNFIKDILELDDAVVIPNCINTQLYKAVSHSYKENVNLVTVSHFSFKDKSKGILDIIEILENVQKCTDLNIRYTVVGGGKYLEYLIEKTKNSPVNVNFTGFLNNPKDILQESDIFVYYSTHDNFPTVILEAMASGLPIVTNYVGAINEMLENGSDGYVARSGEDYASNLLNLINNEKLRVKIGHKARESAIKKFDFNSVAYKYISIYRGLSQ